jgi:queuine tRNA-ribosyltransferase
MGGCDPRARTEFARGLVDKIDVPIADNEGNTIKKIEDGIFGYAIELVDLPVNILNTPPITEDAKSTPGSNGTLDLIRSSFEPLSSTKLRIAHSPPSPHIVLRLIAETGIDLFDVPWLAEAADLGITLDFQFPVPPATPAQNAVTPIGHNLFEERFSMDFEPIGRLESSWPCHSTFSPSHILHGKSDAEQWDPQDRESNSEANATGSFTRAYVHHLLHTHEMGAYALLHLHNLAMMDQFFENVRAFLSQNTAPGSEVKFAKEIIRFYKRYELPDRLFAEARMRWKEVEDARGKGSLKRERDALRSAQGGEEGAPLLPMDDAHPDAGMPPSDAVAVLEEAVEDRM